MLPRFVETPFPPSAIPKTETQKVQHHLVLDLLPTTVGGAR